jgi:hypothetical protein
MTPTKPEIAGARLALLFIAWRIDQTVTNTAKDSITPTHPPRDPEIKIPRNPANTTAQPSALSDKLSRCRAKNRPIGMAIISNSPKERGVTKTDDARNNPFLKSPADGRRA